MEVLKRCSNCDGQTFDFVIEQTGGTCTLCTWYQYRKEAGPAELFQKSRRPKQPVSTAEEQVSHELYNLLQHCEYDCIVGCCGLNAVDLSSDNISGWISQCGKLEVQTLLDYLADLCGRLQRESRTVNFLGDPWPPSLLRLWARELQEVLQLEIQKIASRRSETPD